MSLDVDLMVTKPCSVYSGNITHNLGKMAAEVKVGIGGSLSLYDIMWRPEEHNLQYARQIGDLLDEAFNVLLADPDKFKQYTPENHWGSYEGLVDFVYKYRNACWDNPDAEVSVCR